MTGIFTGVPASLLGHIMRAMIIPAAALVLAGCSSYEELPRQSVDTDFKVFSAISGKAGAFNVFIIKVFESEGMTAMCGGYTRGESSFGKQGSRYWADVSKVKIGDTYIGGAEFMNEMPVYGFRDRQEYDAFIVRILEEAPATNCVRGDVPWQPEFETMEIERTGPDKIRIYD